MAIGKTDSVSYGDVKIDAADNLTLENLNVGASISGYTEYISELNRLIEELREEFKNLSGISTAINNGWTGVSKIAFLQDLAFSVNNVIHVMDIEKDDLINRLTELKNDYIKQDLEMIL